MWTLSECYRQYTHLHMSTLQYICKGIQCVYVHVCTGRTNIQSVHVHTVCMLVYTPNHVQFINSLFIHVL